MSTLNTASPPHAFKVRPGASSFGKIARRSALVFGRILAVLVSILLCVPVILLPPTTSVPAWVWILLAIADVALIILQFRFALASLNTLGVLAGIILVSLVAVAASQYFASTPAITDANGQPI